jgi:hypothetical protein
MEKKMYLEMKEKIEKVILELEKFYDTIKLIEDQKSFALEVIQNTFSGILFALRKGKINSIRIGILQIQTDKLLNFIR